MAHEDDGSQRTRDVIEEVDLELLQEFLGRIGPARIKNDYRARCNKSGRRFIVQFLQDINDHPMGACSLRPRHIAERLHNLMHALIRARRRARSVWSASPSWRAARPR